MSPTQVEHAHCAIGWPAKYRILGVQVSATTYDEAVDAILLAARARQPAIVSLHPVHALITASSNAHLCDAVNRFDMLAPDGQPVRWALKWLHGIHLGDWVYGPEFMLRLCERASREVIDVYFGSTREVIDSALTPLVRRGARGIGYCGLSANDYVTGKKETCENIAGPVSSTERRPHDWECWRDYSLSLSLTMELHHL